MKANYTGSPLAIGCLALAAWFALMPSVGRADRKQELADRFATAPADNPTI